MVRLGRKYDISHWKSSALSYLRQLFSKDPAQWTSSHDDVQELYEKNQSFLFDVINLAYENHIFSIVPVAFLNLFAIHTLVCSQF